MSTLTLGTLLEDELAEQLTAYSRSCCATEGEGCASVKGDSGWRFCLSQDCDVVYFTEEGDTQFTKPQLKVSVGIKESSGERPLCYCFGHSVASIKEELGTKGYSDALADIRAKMKDPGCHCETSNPSGSCCLGSVTKGIQIAQEEMRMNDSTVTPASTAKSSSGETVAKIVTIVSAIMASACCWLPLLLLAVGVSGAGIAATLETYRPLFIAVTFGFLGAAFYFTYRPKKTAAETGHDCCPSESTVAGDCCAPTGNSRFNMMALNKVMLWGVTVLAIGLLFFPSYVGVFLGTADDSALSENMNQAVFKVDGMTCEGCSAIAAESIKTVPGVLAVEVNYERGEAVVGTENCCPMPRDEILAAIKNAGFSGTFNQSVETKTPPRVVRQ
ncbi:mercuric transporter MerT family protein [Crateriforma conspicua]|uniref:mercuric transporter MerT family protein n=1 Tax=Crateriforma conspicua TaxID=2527996 RepID=UPI0018CDC358|nr:mercuric transporter MerT family protein [Crateriforma conspicua]